MKKLTCVIFCIRKKEERKQQFKECFEKLGYTLQGK